jgi:hypothetical protein
MRSNRAGGTFRWTASPNLALSGAGDAAPMVTAIAASLAPEDAWIRLAHTDASGASAVASYRLTVLGSAGVDRPRGGGEPAPALGTFLHYAILDQFGAALARSVRLDAPGAGAVALAARRRSRVRARRA